MFIVTNFSSQSKDIGYLLTTQTRSERLLHIYGISKHVKDISAPKCARLCVIFMLRKAEDGLLVLTYYLAI